MSASVGLGLIIKGTDMMVKCFWLSTDSFRYMTGWMSGHDRYKRRIVAEALKQSENNRELALEMLMNPTAYSTLQVYTCG